MARNLMLRTAILVVGVLFATQAVTQPKKPNFKLCHVVDGIDVRFERESVAVSALERGRVMEQVVRYLNADYCPFGGIKVFGHADSDEGPPEARKSWSIQRAQYVARLLEQGGIPKRLIFIEGYADRQPLIKAPDGRNIRVEVHVLAGCPSEGVCMFPVSASGFRLAPDRSQ